MNNKKVKDVAIARTSDFTLEDLIDILPNKKKEESIF